MEKILGLGPFETRSKRAVPGTKPVSDREFRYIRDDRAQPFEKLLWKIASHVDPSLPKDGAVVSENCENTPPTGEVFQAVSYRGDIDGWRKQVESGARAFGIQLARIADDSIVLDDMRSFKLSECEIKLY